MRKTNCNCILIMENKSPNFNIPFWIQFCILDFYITYAIIGMYYLHTSLAVILEGLISILLVEILVNCYPILNFHLENRKLKNQLYPIMGTMINHRGITTSCYYFFITHVENSGMQRYQFQQVDRKTFYQYNLLATYTISRNFIFATGLLLLFYLYLRSGYLALFLSTALIFILLDKILAMIATSHCDDLIKDHND